VQEILPAKTIQIVKATVPALSVHGHAITKVMYRRLFENKQIRALFNHANQGEDGAQVHALAAAILAYAKNIEDLGALMPAVERIAQKHIGYHILAEHYPFVAEALLGAISEVLGNAATDEVLGAWGEAYWFLANTLKAREAVIRAEIERADGGWTGWRKFVVADKILESAVITSFVLRPTDGGKILQHKPGQYLTFRLDTPDHGLLKRNYSISCGPNDDHYRVSIKREANGLGGSKYFHDHVKVGSIVEATPPAGNFFLSDNPQRPVLLLSGGVGLTPMVSMLEAIAGRHPQLEAHYVHGTFNSSMHALDEHIRALAENHGGISVTSFYSDPRRGDVLGKTFDVKGFISIDWLKSNTPLDTSDIFLCGPKPFLRALVAALSRAGVPSDRIHYEFFGPADEMLAA